MGIRDQIMELMTAGVTTVGLPPHQVGHVQFPAGALYRGGRGGRHDAGLRAGPDSLSPPADSAARLLPQYPGWRGGAAAPGSGSGIWDSFCLLTASYCTRISSTEKNPI